MNTLDNVIILDTETGGLDPFHHSILSIGMVSGDGQVQDEFFVREAELVTDPRAMAVNRIDLDQVREQGLTPSAACERLEAYASRVCPENRGVMAGHNIAFDIAFLRRLYRLANRPIPGLFCHRTIDTHTLLWVLGTAGKLPSDVRSSDAAFRYFDVAPPAALRHTALGDAVATRDLLIHLVNLAGEAPQ
ncbi:MAG: 3'-5' exonuclease [Myxococcota bacterium]|nr:3'-5' exonuclease [Myxococcota bacterium]